MRSIVTSSMYMTVICISLLLVPAAAPAPLMVGPVYAEAAPLKSVPPGAVPQVQEPDEEEYLPIHAVISVRGKAMPEESCTPHGFVVVWEGDLEATDDDPDGIFPARYYEAFDAPFSTLKYDDWACGEGEGRITYTHRYGNKPSACVRLILVDEDEYGNLDRTQWVEFTGFELGHVFMSGDVTEPSTINTDGQFVPGTLTPPLALTAEDFERGFERTYHFGGTCDFPTPAPFACGHFDDHNVEGTLVLSYKQETKKPKVEIAGCAHLLPGGSEQLTATGTPSGGRYRWSAEPSSVLSASGNESSVDVKGGEPGHATVRVEYESPSGKRVEGTLSGSVVTLTSVNGGAAIPTLYLYDAYGNARPPIEVPIVQDPPDGDLLKFVVTDPSIATVDNLGSSLLIQGVREGSTTAQAQTKCGEKTGPVITLEVAGCDPEMIAKLRENYKEKKKQLDESVHRVNQAITSKDFNEASDQIKDDIVDTAIEAVDVAAGGAAKLGSATKAVKAAEEVISLGSTGWNVYRDDVKVTAIKAAVVVLVPGVGVGLVSTYDKLNTVGKLLKHTAALVDADERIAREQPIQDGLSKELEQIDKLIEKCKRESKGVEPEPKAPPLKPGPTPPKPGPTPPKPGPTPPKGEPTPPKGEPGGEQPVPGEPTPAEPVEPGGGETPPSEPPTEPPKPPTPPGGGGGAGLPIDCGCKDASTASWRSEETGLAAIAASLSLLQGCAERYAEELRSFQADSAAIVETVRTIEAALEIPGEKGFEQFSEALPGLEAAESSYESLSKAADDFRRTIEGCDTKVPQAVELIRTAGQPPETTTPGVKPK